MMSEKKVPQWKIEEVNNLVELMEKYENIAVINLSGMNDRQVQEMRKILREDAVIRMSKKSLQTRALEMYQEKSDKENLDELKKRIPGQSALVFTDINPFELKKIFNDSKKMVPAKPGQITPVDIIVPAGDTGLPTGQVISELNMTLKLPTMIKNDTIHIREDTTTHKAGDVVNMKEASVLKKLGIEPIESIIKIHIAWSDGHLLPADILYMNMGEFKQNIQSCYSTARILAIELGFIDEETIFPLTQRAFREAIALLFEVPILDESLIDKYMQKAQTNANIINSVVFGKPITTTSVKKEDKKKEEKTEEEEEDEPAGIGGLF